MNERNLKLDNAKGLLIILVVIGHFILPIASATRLTYGLYNAIYSFHMPAMVFISGYFAKSLVKDGRFQFGKVKYILIWYIIFEVLVFFTEKLAYPSDLRFPDFLHESGAPWYLISLATWYMTVPFASFLRGSKKRFLVPLIVMLVAIILKQFVVTNHFLSLDRTIAFAPYFYAGYYIEKDDIDDFCSSPVRFAVIAVAALALIYIFFFGQDKLGPVIHVIFGSDVNAFSEDVRPYLWVADIVWYMYAFAATAALIALMPNKKVPVLTVLGGRTLQIYILHRLIRDLVLYFGLYDALGSANAAVLGIVFGSILLTVLLGNEYINKWFNKIREVII